MSESIEDSLVDSLVEDETPITSEPSEKPYHHSQVSRIQCIFAAILDGVRISEYATLEKQYEEEAQKFLEHIESCKSVETPAA